MRSPGFTLLELLIVLLIGAIVLTLGVPAFSTSVLDARRTADVNAFVTSIHLARSESATRSTAVSLCRSTDGVSCAGSGSDFTRGWIVVTDDTAATPLLSHTPVMHGSIRSNRASFTFRPSFQRSTNGTVIFCDQRGSASARAIVISYTGRPRVSRTDTAGRPLSCTA